MGIFLLYFRIILGKKTGRGDQTMYLPENYMHRMQDLLENEFQAFMESYESTKLQGLRINTLKISVEEFLRISPFNLRSIPWCKDGFYFEEGERPAKHPYYHAGLYYIQEPSAMAPVEVLNVHPKDCVLDLCAAPGGKSVQIGAALQGEGILITNDINFNRVKPLIKNIELYGIKNAIVMNENPGKMEAYFISFFNKVLVDAPCSGEGMFRKDRDMVKSWENNGVEYYVSLQRKIMGHISNMIQSGGRLLYSTCTFSPEENEGTINEFIHNHKGFHLVETPKENGFCDGRPEWINGDESLKFSARLWPHWVEGEGHFLALLEKEEDEKEHLRINGGKDNTTPKKEFYEFVKENLTISLEGVFEIHNDQLYMLPNGLPPLKGLKILRSGWFLGNFKKGRFEPSHAMAMGIKRGDAKRVVCLDSEGDQVIKYLKGETLDIEGEKGWTLVCVEDYPIGWAKQTGNMLKNYYPPGWRWL